MEIGAKGVGNRLVLSPQEPIVGGGAAEAFERHLQKLFRSGYRDLIVDLSGVTDARQRRRPRAGPRPHQRPAGRRQPADRRPAIRAVRQVLDAVAARRRPRALRLGRGGADCGVAVAEHPHLGVGRGALSTALVAIGHQWPTELSGIADGGTTIVPLGGGGPSGAPVYRVSPFIELLKLVAAAAIGQLVTSIHQPSPRERPLARSMEQAQTLLCVSGAMMMIIIGNNLARAFGIAGAASIIRFRTPVDDPKDVTILFLLMALGMATGLGSFARRRAGHGLSLRRAAGARPLRRPEHARDVGRDPRARPSVSDQPCRGRLRAQSRRLRAARNLAGRRRDGEVPDVARSARRRSTSSARS